MCKKFRVDDSEGVRGLYLYLGTIGGSRVILDKCKDRPLSTPTERNTDYTIVSGGRGNLTLYKLPVLV